MRIRTALATGVLAATFVVGGAGGALAHGAGSKAAEKSAEVSGKGWLRGCEIHAGIYHDNPYYGESCFGGGFEFAAKKEAKKEAAWRR
ncbi:hypothetical protein [Streptomyces avicenniae]|uniref:hypothetical protein n=1 Tax=Streptomyces avicenniae TaxID=500153 RepID=UPI00069B4E70|nr:hypothetical protein [Streptomyces avicenniae]